MQTQTNIKHVLELCNYKDWHIILRGSKNEPCLQVQFMAPDSFTGEVCMQHCRKWKLSYHMTDSEIVQTAYAAVKMAVLHEVAEDFRFLQEPIFRPHYDVYELRAFCKQNKTDVRL